MYFVEPFLVTPATPPTRASAATYLDSVGVLRYAAVNEVRPIIETLAATNLIAYSAVFSLASNYGVLYPALTTGPDAISNADVVVSESGSGRETGLSSASSTALVVGETYGASVFVRPLASLDLYRSVYRCVVRIGGAQVLVRTVAAGGYAVGVVSSTSGSNAKIVACGGGWTRISLKFTASSTAAVKIIVLMDVGVGDEAEQTEVSNSDRQLAAWGAQIELDAASSYIPTSGAPATRAADILPVAVAGVSDMLNSNVPLTDYASWVSGTAYAVGAFVAVSTDIYEALAASTGVNPVGDISGKWVNAGKVNAWRMFDGYMHSVTRRAESIEVVLQPGAAANSLVIFGAVAAAAEVMVYDACEGLIYEKTASMVSHVPGASWHAHYFSPQVAKDIWVLNDLPLSRNCTITVRLSLPGGFVECGMCIVGRSEELGRAQWGLGFGIQDYSSKVRNVFGGMDIVERTYADRANYQLIMPASDNQRIKRSLARVRAKACVYVGHPNYPESIVLGYYKSFDPVLSYLTHSDCNLEIEGL